MKKDIIAKYGDLMFAEGFDKAIIGVDSQTGRVIYSIDKCIQILQEDHDMTENDAVDYFYFNCEAAYVGERTPIWCDDYL